MLLVQDVIPDDPDTISFVALDRRRWRREELLDLFQTFPLCLWQQEKNADGNEDGGSGEDPKGRAGPNGAVEVSEKSRD